ncbi:MAG: hypothetical protein R8K21_01125 [Mariprofundales bacterium]
MHVINCYFGDKCKQRRQWSLLLLALLAGLLFACGGSDLDDPGQKVAIDVFRAIQYQQYDQALKYYDVEFIKEQGGKEKWKKHLEALWKALGQFERDNLSRSSKELRKDGQYYTLEYDNRYSRMRHVREVIKLRRIHGEPDFKIIEHKILMKAL